MGFSFAGGGGLVWWWRRVGEGRRGGLVWSFNHGIAISTQIGVSLNLGKQRLARAQFRASLGVVMNAVMMGLLATVLWFGRCGVCPPLRGSQHRMGPKNQ